MHLLAQRVVQIFILMDDKKPFIMNNKGKILFISLGLQVQYSCMCLYENKLKYSQQLFTSIKLKLKTLTFGDIKLKHTSLDDILFSIFLIKLVCLDLCIISKCELKVFYAFHLPKFLNFYYIMVW